MRLAAAAALVLMTGCFIPIEDHWLGSADAGGSLPQPGCTLENCRAIVEACRVEPEGSPAATCAAVAPAPANFDFAPYCVNACNAQRGSGEVIQCVAGKADQCRAALDGGASVPSVYAACSAGSSSGVPQQACQAACTSARTTCDDRCSGGRACDNCRRAATPDCSSVCPDAGFKECTDCSAACGLSSVACVDACPRVSALKPGVMFLIDKSGSMNFAADDSAAACTPGCNQSGAPACASGCTTRLQALKAALNSFLTSNTSAWMGMAIFPTGAAGTSGTVDACGATSAADVRVQLSPQATDPAAGLAAAAGAVNTQIQALAAGGGTPTGDSLKFLGTYGPLNDPARENFVVLITDGLPNCNSANANTCTGSLCRCTLVPATSCMPASFCTQGCLDSDATTAQVDALRMKGIRTIVVGFGAETAAGDGPDTLNAMAERGGFARACPNGTDAECGSGNTCTTANKLCGRRYYQASSAAELDVVLAEISNRVF